MASTTPRFRIEFVLPSRGLVFARALDSADFRLTGASALGGCRVKHFDLPRKLKADGTPDLELFAFFLHEPEDVAKLHVGDTVGYEE